MSLFSLNACFYLQQCLFVSFDYLSIRKSPFFICFHFFLILYCFFLLFIPCYKLVLWCLKYYCGIFLYCVKIYCSDWCNKKLNDQYLGKRYRGSSGQREVGDNWGTQETQRGSMRYEMKKRYCPMREHRSIEVG